MNNKGFAVSGILYTLLIIFMVSMITLLFNLQNRKTILDELKADAVDAVESDNNYEYLLNEINTLKSTVATADNIYPVGSIYISVDDTNPSELFGGTWEAYASGKTLIGVDLSNDNYSTSGKTGGSSTATLSAANLPSHTHSIPSLSGTATSSGAHTHNFSTGGTALVVNASTSYSGMPLEYGFVNGMGEWWSGGNKNIAKISSAGAHTHPVTTTASTTGATGSGTSFSVQNPYITVYMWKRVS